MLGVLGGGTNFFNPYIKTILNDNTVHVNTKYWFYYIITITHYFFNYAPQFEKFKKQD